MYESLKRFSSSVMWKIRSESDVDKSQLCCVFLGTKHEAPVTVQIYFRGGKKENGQPALRLISLSALSETPAKSRPYLISAATALSVCLPRRNGLRL
ncbi:hypothetical protein MHYP_G00020150 [Metynnis hypsauchen]